MDDMQGRWKPDLLYAPGSSLRSGGLLRQQVQQGVVVRGVVPMGRGSEGGAGGRGASSGTKDGPLGVSHVSHGRQMGQCGAALVECYQAG